MDVNPQKSIEDRRRIGDTDMLVSPVALGCWPIAGMTSLDVNPVDSRKTLDAALALGVNFLDTAYAYGARGESERLIGEAIRGRRDQVVLATKCGLGWDEHGQRVIDGRAETLKRQVDVSLSRLGVDHVDILYLHAPDPQTSVAESAGALSEIMTSGKARLIGASNLSLDQLTLFHSLCPLGIVQPPYNLLQRQIESDIVPWCLAHHVAIAVYWPLMKGLLAGKLPRDHAFSPEDGRAKYPMFQGQQWQRNQDFVDELRQIAAECGITVAQLSVRWTLEQPGITAALCGAKRAYQIEETAMAMRFSLGADVQARIAAALRRRGPIDVRGAV